MVAFISTTHSCHFLVCLDSLLLRLTRGGLAVLPLRGWMRVRAGRLVAKRGAWNHVCDAASATAQPHRPPPSCPNKCDARFGKNVRFYQVAAKLRQHTCEESAVIYCGFAGCRQTTATSWLKTSLIFRSFGQTAEEPSVVLRKRRTINSSLLLKETTYESSLFFRSFAAVAIRHQVRMTYNAA